jgi:hypothetical protein
MAGSLVLALQRLYAVCMLLLLLLMLADPRGGLCLKNRKQRREFKENSRLKRKKYTKLAFKDKTSLSSSACWAAADASSC